MRVLVISLFIILMSISAYADHIFPDSELKDFQVVEVRKDEGKALVRDANGNEAEIFVGDNIGVDGEIVTRIGDASITVRSGNTKTKIHVTYGFGQ